MRNEFGCGGIVISDIVFGGIPGAAPIEHIDHQLFCSSEIDAACQRIAQEMTMIEVMREMIGDGWWEPLEPISIVSAKSDVERDQVSDLLSFDRLKFYRSYAHRIRRRARHAVHKPGHPVVRLPSSPARVSRHSDWQWRRYSRGRGECERG